MIALKYIGAGAALIGVPARDLTDEEAKKYNKKRLIESGLYEQAKKPKGKKHEQRS